MKVADLSRQCQRAFSRPPRFIELAQKPERIGQPAETDDFWILTVLNKMLHTVRRRVMAHRLLEVLSSLGQLTRLLAAELAPRVRVNAVLPGAVETDSLRAWLERQDPKLREGMLSRIAMRRLGQPQDIADAVLFLASPASSWITGKLLEVDGLAQPDLMPNRLPDL